MSTGKKRSANTIRNKAELKKFGLDAKKIFPRSKIKRGGELTPYQRRRARQFIIHKSQDQGVVLAPDRPDYYALAGFTVLGDLVYPASERIRIDTLYYAEGASEFYTARFYGAVMHVQLIPSVALPDFLEAQIAIDEEEGQFYDRITLREADRNVWGGENGFGNMHESAQDLRAHLERYVRHGALIGKGDTHGYIQVCYIITEFDA